MLHFGGRERLGEHISYHVICGAVNKMDRPLLNDPVDPMVPHIDMLGLQIVLVIVCECNGCLIVGEESGGGLEVTKYLSDEAAKP